MNDFAAALQEHYSRRAILPTILESLNRKGMDLAQVRPEHLYPYDQSHAGGIEATRLLARRAGIESYSSLWMSAAASAARAASPDRSRHEPRSSRSRELVQNWTSLARPGPFVTGTNAATTEGRERAGEVRGEPGRAWKGC